MKRRLPIVILVLVAAVAAFFWWRGRRAAERDDGALLASGTVEATEAQLGFEAGGRITEVLAREGDEVAAGAPLARLEASEATARRRQAEAQVEAARARLAELQAGARREEVAQAAAGVEAARVRVDNAESELARAERLFQGGAISREAYDRAATAQKVAAAEVERAAEQLALLRRGTRREAIAAQAAVVAQAEAALAASDAALAKLALAAPFAGRVTVRHREPGETVAPGSPIVTLLDSTDRWVRIYVPEPRIGAVHLGTRAEILSDTFPDKPYAGEVVFIASQAEFTPKSVQTQEERVRLVYAVKVRVEGDPAFELKPGMPVDVRLAVAAPAADPSP